MENRIGCRQNDIPQCSQYKDSKRETWDRWIISLWHNCGNVDIDTDKISFGDDRLRIIAFQIIRMIKIVNISMTKLKIVLFFVFVVRHIKKWKGVTDCNTSAKFSF